MISGWRRVTGCCYTSDMLGELPNQWSPWRYLRDKYPLVTVFEMELEPGLMGCLDHFKGVIWLDTDLTSAEKRCTVAHELGHLELDTVEGGQALAAAEDLVDRWASRMLIPVNNLVRAFRWSLHLDEIADELWVDNKTLRARLRALTDEEQDAIMKAIRRHDEFM